MEQKQEKTPKTKAEKKALTKTIVIWALCITAVVLLAIFSKSIFQSDLYGEDANGFVAIGQWFQLNALNFLKTAILVLILWMILWLRPLHRQTRLEAGPESADRRFSLASSMIKWTLIFIGLFVDLRLLGRRYGVFIGFDRRDRPHHRLRLPIAHQRRRRRPLHRL
jgi:hypothetical protein